jgi:hypothetical protein
MHPGKEDDVENIPKPALFSKGLEVALECL